jgi:hypothetical protein
MLVASLHNPAGSNAAVLPAVAISPHVWFMRGAWRSMQACLAAAQASQMSLFVHVCFHTRQMMAAGFWGLASAC